MGLSKGAANTIILGTTLGLALCLVLAACIITENWLPMLMLVPFAFLPIILVFTESLNQSLVSEQLACLLFDRILT